MEKLTIGFCPTRRDCFSREEAWRYRDLIRRSLDRYDVRFVDLEGINEEAFRRLWPPRRHSAGSLQVYSWSDGRCRRARRRGTSDPLVVMNWREMKWLLS